MKNKMSDLTNHLFAQLERLGDEALTPDQIEQEVKRAEAIVRVSDQIVSTADTQLKAARLFADHGPQILPHLPLIGRSE